MPRAIQIETQAEQQGLTQSRAQRTTGRASRELAPQRTERTFDRSTAATEASWERSAHLGTHCVQAPRFLSELGRDRALHPELAPDIGAIPLARRQFLSPDLFPNAERSVSNIGAESDSVHSQTSESECVLRLWRKCRYTLG